LSEGLAQWQKVAWETKPKPANPVNLRVVRIAKERMREEFESHKIVMAQLSIQKPLPRRATDHGGVNSDRTRPPRS
jgi:hypothetical protein